MEYLIKIPYIISRFALALTEKKKLSTSLADQYLWITSRFVTIVLKMLEAGDSRPVFLSFGSPIPRKVLLSKIETREGKTS